MNATDYARKEVRVVHPKGLKRTLKNRLGEYAIEKVIFLLGLVSVVIIALIFYFLIKNGIALFETVSLKAFLFGRDWFPVSANPQYGIVPLVAGSLLVTLGAILISVPLGIGCAIYIAEIAPRKIRSILKVIVEFLSAIPSVVLGFLGVIFLSNRIRLMFNLSSGFTALTGSILVSLMALPTIISISDDAFNALPPEYREASLALGATQWETIRHVLIPAAASGMIASVMLGIGRAIGETMTVMMVTGNAAKIPDSFLSSARTMTATIAAEMGDTVRDGTHYFSLFAVGIVLLLMTSLINLIADAILYRGRKEGRP